MIRRVQLKNFQSHKSTSLEFTPGVNYIVGTSDSGKTAIIRALRWVNTNRPSGTAYRSNWGGDTEVLVVTDEGLVIRRRTDKKNEYEVDGVVLKALKTDVPEEVKNVLNLGSINFQNQFDKSFLLSATSGEVAEHFNKVANFEKIGKTIRTLTSMLQRHVRQVEVKKGRINELRATLKEYAFIPRLEDRVEDLEGKLRRFKEFSAQVDALYALVKKLPIIQEKIRKTSNLLVLEQKVIQVELKMQKKRQLIENIRKLSSLINSLQNIVIHFQEFKALLALESSVKSIEKKLQTKQILFDSVKILTKNINDLRRVDLSITRQEKAVELAEKDYHNNFPDVCPLCGSKITKI